ncbi:MAG TPA: NrsF family protein [Bryobacteraceae bacterium]|nr:NrsF family protein [Bryobacteraceae bacterium]
MQTNPRDADLDRQLETWGASQADVELSPEIRRKVQGILTSSLTPVKPLPSQSRLLFGFVSVFVVGAVGLIALMDKAGFHLMTAGQMASMTAILTGGGILFSHIVAWQMVPGSRRRFPLWPVLALSGFGVFGGIALLFPWRTSQAFVSEGWPCAVVELTIAVPAAVVFWLLTRRGALFGGAGVGAALGGLAVVLALAVLQFRCMFQQAPHLLVWHGGTAAILIGLGALIGEARHHRRM